jgi:hypothetical protein
MLKNGPPTSYFQTLPQPNPRIDPIPLLVLHHLPVLFYIGSLFQLTLVPTSSIFDPRSQHLIPSLNPTPHHHLHCLFLLIQLFALLSFSSYASFLQVPLVDGVAWVGHPNNSSNPTPSSLALAFLPIRLASSYKETFLRVTSIALEYLHTHFVQYQC